MPRFAVVGSGYMGGGIAAGTSPLQASRQMTRYGR